jgi:hypothetical protein
MNTHKLSVLKLARFVLNLITGDAAFYYIQHTAAVICLINDFNLISCYGKSCVFFTCLYVLHITYVRDFRLLIAAVNLNFYFLHAKPDDGYFSLLKHAAVCNF